MHFKLKVIQIGNSLGVTLPKEMLAAMNVEKGDALTLTSTSDGVRLTAYDDAQSAQMEAARKIMKKRRHVLRELAK
ncbi:MAG TPA: AbrB/MazE/SpoVT family DNA-binding domain-containing protein [Rhizomicrobium sp.]|jgi:putative addiction module antidote|nr:AbrB/MazE/SpoVT family DNA-binding domain-containing protein [Rhizomicrobium sp.]HEX4533545.1 AbrB/MazE/SpoVT family DNA-binding domain-containing protein [Rhizomicrobium sp.]